MYKDFNPNSEMSNLLLKEGREEGGGRISLRCFKVCKIVKQGRVCDSEKVDIHKVRELNIRKVLPQLLVGYYI